MKDKEIQTQQDVDDLNKKIDGCKTNQQIVDTLKTVKLDKIPIMSVSAKDQYTEQKLRYIPYYEQDATGGLEFEFFTSHMNAVKSPLLLTGPTGTAKTLAVAWFAQENDAVCLQVDCSEGTKRADLLGRFIILDGSVQFQLGTIPMAIEIANQTGKAILDFEEVNGLQPHMQKVLNQFLDWRDHVYIPEIGRMFKVDSDKKLMVFSTMNPSTYGGTNELNKDFKRRYTVFKWPYPSSDQEFKILEHDGVDEKWVKGIIQLGMELRASEAQGDIDNSPSPATNQKFCDVLREYAKNTRISACFNGQGALHYALLHTILNDFDVPSQKDLVQKRVQRIFGIKTLGDQKADDD
jgi:midasin (ATPase involved in ribosome maturation)